MAIEFSFTASSMDGTVQRGSLYLESAQAVRDYLVDQGLRPIAVKRKSSHGSGKTPQNNRLRSMATRNLEWPIWSIDIEVFLQQLAVMLESGLELSTCLGELSQQSTKRTMKSLAARLGRAVEQGESLSAAFAHESKIPSLVVELSRVGEQSGQLSHAMQRAAQHLERKREAQTSLVAALSYPLLVALAAIGVAAYLVTSAIPKLAVFLHAMGRKMPPMTQSLLDVADWLRDFGPGVVACCFVSITSLLLISLWPPGRIWLDRIVLRLPIVGKLIRIAATEQLASSVALMLRSGVLLQDALGSAAKLHQNRFLASEVRAAQHRVTVGGGLAVSLAKRGGFPAMLASMVAVGERTGELPRSLEQVAKFYEDQLNASLRRLSRLVEPAIIIVVGGLVGYVYVAFFMALLSAGGNFQ